MSFQWDNVAFDLESIKCLEQIKQQCNHYSIVAERRLLEEGNDTNKRGEENKTHVDSSENESSDEDYQLSLVNAERVCHNFIKDLDDNLKILDEVSSSYDDVTGRTNSLMLNCEHLLEQQVNLQITLKFCSLLTEIIFFLNNTL